MAWTADDLVTAVRLSCRLPDTALTAAEILSLADQATDSVVVPLVRSAQGDYYVTYADVSIVAGTTYYRLPARAQGNTLRDVTVIDTTGAEVPAEYRDLKQAWPGVAVASTSSYLYVIEGDRIALLPTPTSSGGSIRLRYSRRPSRLIPTASAYVVSAVTSPTIVSVTGTGPASPYDAVSKGPPGGSRGDDLPGAVVTGTLTLSSGHFDSDIAVGDYVASAGYTPVPQMPAEAQALLISATCVRVLKALGDQQGLASAMAELADVRQEVASLLVPRVEGEPQPWVNWNSPMRWGH